MKRCETPEARVKRQKTMKTVEDDPPCYNDGDRIMFIASLAVAFRSATQLGLRLPLPLVIQAFKIVLGDLVECSYWEGIARLCNVDEEPSARLPMTMRMCTVTEEHRVLAVQEATILEAFHVCLHHETYDSIVGMTDTLKLKDTLPAHIVAASRNYNLFFTDDFQKAVTIDTVIAKASPVSGSIEEQTTLSPLFLKRKAEIDAYVAKQKDNIHYTEQLHALDDNLSKLAASCDDGINPYEAQDFVRYKAELISIIANSSTDFKQKHEEKLCELKSKFDEVSTAAVVPTLRTLDVHLTKTLAAFSGLTETDPNLQASLDDCIAEFRATGGLFKRAETLNLNKIGQPAFVEAWDAKAAQLTGLVGFLTRVGIIHAKALEKPVEIPQINQLYTHLENFQNIEPIFQVLDFTYSDITAAEPFGLLCQRVRSSLSGIIYEKLAHFVGTSTFTLMIQIYEQFVKSSATCPKDLFNDATKGIKLKSKAVHPNTARDIIEQSVELSSVTARCSSEPFYSAFPKASDIGKSAFVNAHFELIPTLALYIIDATRAEDKVREMAKKPDTFSFTDFVQDIDAISTNFDGNRTYETNILIMSMVY